MASTKPPKPSESGRHDGTDVEPATPHSFSAWQKGAFLLASALLLTGLSLQAWFALSRQTEAPTAHNRRERASVRPAAAPSAGEPAASPTASALLPGHPPTLAPSLLPDGGAQPARSARGEEQTTAAVENPDAAPSVAERAAPVLTESGVMFFVGFCMGAALRAIARAVIVLFGLVLLALLGLQYAGVIPPIDWHAVGSVLQSVAALLEQGADKLQAVLTHTLPSGTMAGLGLATGLRHR